MIEKDLQDLIKSKIKTVLEPLDIKTQYLGLLDIGNETDEDGLKLNEDEEYDARITIKVDPSSYDTPTIPDAQYTVTVYFDISAGIDYNGKTYIDITDELEKLFYTYQKTFTTYYNAFKIEDKFEPTGFQLTGGDYSLDKDKCTWTFMRSFTLYGIVLT